MTAPDKVYIHIGLHKTGTTFLQNVWRANRHNLRAQQIYFCGGRDEPVQAFAVWDLQGRRPRDVEDKRISGQWDSLVAHVNECGLPTALVSEERLSLSTLKQVRKVVDAFGDSEVHVVVTARDLGRVAVSAWQEAVKNSQTWTWPFFSESVRDPASAATSPSRGFWMRQDLAKICETWESAVPADRIHVVTVPPPGASPDELMKRVADVVGFAPSALTEKPAWNNETVGVAAAEVIRRVNERLGGRLNQRAYDRVVKMTLVQQLARRTEPVRFALPADELPWYTARAEEMISAVSARGYPVTGDLTDLMPRPTPDARRPDDASEAELLDASLDALTLLAETHATSWWAHKRGSVEDVAERGDLASRTRGAVFRAQRKAVALADRSPVAAKAVGAVLKARDRARIKARDKTT